MSVSAFKNGEDRAEMETKTFGYFEKNIDTARSAK